MSYFWGHMGKNHMLHYRDGSAQADFETRFVHFFDDDLKNLP